MVVYLSDTLTPSQKVEMIGRLQQLYGAVTYVSKDQAWKEFSEQVGDPALLQAVGANPLPASLRIKLRPELLNYAAMERAAQQVSQFPQVEDVRYGGDWVRRLDQLKDGLVRGAIAVGTVVALAVVFVLYNTIRLGVLARLARRDVGAPAGAAFRGSLPPMRLRLARAALQLLGSALLLAAPLHAQDSLEAEKRAELERIQQQARQHRATASRLRGQE